MCGGVKMMSLLSFFDAYSEPEFREEGPKLHHFRSTNFKNEEYWRKCWHECVETEVIIPAHLIRTEDQDGNVEQIYTDYLNGPLFTEFTSLRPQNPSEQKEMPCKLMTAHQHLKMQAQFYMLPMMTIKKQTVTKEKQYA